MSLVVAPPNQVKTRVYFNVPRADALGTEKQDVVATIRKLYAEEKENFMESVGEKKDVDVIRELVVDVKGFLDADKNEIPWSDDLIHQIKDIDYIVTPLARECISVQDESMRKVLQQKN